jgi:hypothetical protein
MLRRMVICLIIIVGAGASFLACGVEIACREQAAF